MALTEDLGSISHSNLQPFVTTVPVDLGMRDMQENTHTHKIIFINPFNQQLKQQYLKITNILPIPPKGRVVLKILC